MTDRIPLEADDVTLSFTDIARDTYTVEFEDGDECVRIRRADEHGDEISRLGLLTQDIPRLVALLQAVHDWHTAKEKAADE